MPLEPPLGIPDHDIPEIETDQSFAVARANRHWTRKILDRIRSSSTHDALMYGFARFYTLRTTIRTSRRLLREQTVGEQGRSSGHLSPAAAIDDIVEHLTRQSWSPAAELAPDTVQQLLAQSRSWPFFCRALPDSVSFRLEDRQAVERRYGKPITLAEVRQAETRELIDEISSDPVLHEIAARYLGYPATRILPRFLVSFVSGAPTSNRLEQKQTVLYHYDLDDFNEVIFNFYLTDVTEQTGAHVLIPGTHRAKKIRHLMCSVNFTDEEIRRSYPHAEPAVVTGSAGLGFVEDPFCFHKALPPRFSSRTLLQLRYM